MISFIKLYRPMNYENLKNCYKKIISLPTIRNTGYRFFIDNNLSKKVRGYESTDGKITINLYRHGNLSELIETIAHEVAHIEEPNHGSRHDSLTKRLRTGIEEQIK